jgi:hypothetical protein
MYVEGICRILINLMYLIIWQLYLHQETKVSGLRHGPVCITLHSFIHLRNYLSILYFIIVLHTNREFHIIMLQAWEPLLFTIWSLPFGLGSLTSVLSVYG